MRQAPHVMYSVCMYELQMNIRVHVTHYVTLSLRVWTQYGVKILAYEYEPIIR